MKEHLRKKSLCLAGAALLLAGSMTAGSAMAYFTTYATASGGAEVSLDFTHTEPGEEVVDWTKRITVKNTGSVDCYVRVKLFAGEKYLEGLDISGEGWERGEGDYYYYNKVVPAGKTSSLLSAKIGNMESEEDFNVIVVQESTPVLYSENGDPYGDWNVVLDRVQESHEQGGTR